MDVSRKEVDTLNISLDGKEPREIDWGGTPENSTLMMYLCTGGADEVEMERQATSKRLSAPGIGAKAATSTKKQASLASATPLTHVAKQGGHCTSSKHAVYARRSAPGNVNAAQAVLKGRTKIVLNYSSFECIKLTSD